MGYQGYTSQLRDSVSWALQNSYALTLYVRASTNVSGPLEAAFRQAAAAGYAFQIVRSL